MRILQICSARDIGGGERHVADLANSLTGRGHDVFAVVNPNAALIGGLRSLPKENILELPMRGSADALAAEQIARIIRDKKIDVIHVHMARDYPIAAIASARSGTPFVLTRHVLFPMRRVHKLLLGRVSRVIAVSKAVEGVLIRQGIFPPDKVVTIHNGIDAERFSRRHAHRDGRPMRIGTIGHIAPIKGQDVFVNAAAKIIGHRDDVEFIIAGEDKSPRRENDANLRELIDSLGLTGRIQILGWQDDVASVLDDLDIFVSAARSEPFGLVILEAMAAGVTIISTASEGALEIIENGVSGLLVPIDDADALAAAVIRLLNDRQLGQQLAANGREQVDQRFSLTGMVDATEMVYREALN